MNAPAGLRSVAERLADAAVSLSPGGISAQARLRCEDLLVDVGGLCVAARANDYVRALVASVDGGGPCTAIGHTSGFRAEDAAMIGGTAAHGEDFDDTFEGGPVHSGAVIVPAVLAACERFQRDGQAALFGIASGVETMCRLSLVAPKLIHKAGFHPTSVLGAMAATLGVFDALTRDFGREWLMEGLTFKPYATGTMNQPYIDCALRLARKGFAAEEVVEVLCETAEGYVHRLWEPIASKHRPANDYAAKFSTPFNIAVAFVTGGAGFEAFTDKTVRDPRILALASRVRYVVDPNNPYPKAYTGHVKMTLRDGRVFEERQPHIRGGVHEPLTREEIERKFRSNAGYGGWDRARAERFLQFARSAFDRPVDLSGFRG